MFILVITSVEMSVHQLQRESMRRIFQKKKKTPRIRYENGKEEAKKSNEKKKMNTKFQLIFLSLRHSKQKATNCNGTTDEN